MRVRFDRPPRAEPSREDGLGTPLGPARRPRGPYWQWYLVLTALVLPVAVGVVWLLRQMACAP